MIGLLPRRIAEYLSVVFIRERDAAQSRGHILGHIGSAASIDYGSHVEATGNTVVVDSDRIGRDANRRHVAEPDLATRWGINAQGLKIGKTLPDLGPTPNHHIEDLLFFIKASNGQA
jgi:hypothetical protein